MGHTLGDATWVCDWHNAGCAVGRRDRLQRTMMIRDRGRSHHKPFPFLRWLMIIVMLLGAIGIQDFCQIIISPPI
jgi:hypothetical protein